MDYLNTLYIGLMNSRFLADLPTKTSETGTKVELPGSTGTATTGGDVAKKASESGVTPITSTTGFTETVGKILNFVFILAGILAVIYLVISGIQYITSGGDATKAENARKGIINAVIGIVVILVALLLVRWVVSIVTSGTA